MKLNLPQTIVSYEGFGPRAEIDALAAGKAAKLRRHRLPRLGDIRVHLKHETPREGVPLFVACATAEARGSDLVAHGSGPEPEDAVASVFARLVRAAKDVAGIHKHARHESV